MNKQSLEGNYYVDKEDLKRMVEIVSCLTLLQGKILSSEERDNIYNVYKEALTKVCGITSLKPSQFAMRFKHNVEQTLQAVTNGDATEPPKEPWDLGAT